MNPQAFAVGLGERMELAFLLMSLAQRGKLTYGRIGELVAELEGRGRAYSDLTVGRWARGEQPPDSLLTIAAIAELAGCDPGWLAFGPLSDASPPDTDSGRRSRPVRRR